MAIEEFIGWIAAIVWTPFLFLYWLYDEVLGGWLLVPLGIFLLWAVGHAMEESRKPCIWALEPVPLPDGKIECYCSCRVNMMALPFDEIEPRARLSTNCPECKRMVQLEGFDEIRRRRSRRDRLDG